MNDQQKHEALVKKFDQLIKLSKEITDDISDLHDSGFYLPKEQPACFVNLKTPIQEDGTFYTETLIGGTPRSILLSFMLNAAKDKDLCRIIKTISDSIEGYENNSKDFTVAN